MSTSDDSRDNAGTKSKPALAEGVSATPYQGTFTVVNCTGQTINNVSVKHTCGNYMDPAASASLPPGGTIASVPLRAQTGSNDYWNLSFQMSDGSSRSRNSKQCNYVQSDAPGTCITRPRPGTAPAASAGRPACPGCRRC
ncbi:hypothetical protein NB693_20310 [Pantoea ananatis]|uniref:hypothetical protein n=1 Tax=Pantoea ananas TaxID=553 RepID=UPI00221FB613|nr:hypothetical protein [Pantoea ananatis]